jgi:MFS family permease
MNSSHPLARRTFICDSMRLCLQGSLDTAFLSVFLLIAIRVFHAPLSLKAFLATLAWLGGVFSPWLTRWVARSRLPATRIGACLFICIGLCFALAMLTRSFAIFVLIVALASIPFRGKDTILIGMYTRNYPISRMATYFSIGMVLSSLMSIFFGQLSGYILDSGLENYHYLMGFAMLCSWGCAGCLWAIPSMPVELPAAQKKPYLAYLKEDKVFAKMAFFSFFTGIAYQMLVPIRMEYLANNCYGLHLSNFSVMLLSWGILSVSRLVSAPILGRLFDTLHIIPMQVLTGSSMLIGYLLFFTTHSFLLLSVGSAFLGVAVSGKFIVHNFWVSRVVPEDAVSACMSVHVLLSGIRSLLAPLIGYGLLALSTPRCVAYVGCAVVTFGIAGFWSMRNVLANR